MTAIDDVSTNDMNFKHLDTSKDIVITPRNEFGGQVLLNTAHTWTAKVSDGNNYVGDYPVTLESNSIVVNSADFTNLPAGYYHLEIWEEWIDSNSKKQRSIYPSPQRTIDFTIYQNVTDLAEKEIKTIGFQDVVDQAVMNIGMNYVFKVNTIEPDQTATVVQAAADGKNYVTFNIPRGYKGDKGDPGVPGVPGDPGDRGLPGNDGLTPHIDAKTGHWMLGNLDTGVTAKGDKGDTGSVDNAGLTNAPAFQALQTQVQDSAVGTNLLQGTGTASGDVYDEGVLVNGAFNGYDAVKTNTAWSGRRINLKQSLGRTTAKAGDWYTISVYVKADQQIDTGVLNVYRVLGNVNADTGALNDISMQNKPITTQWQQYAWSFQINNMSLQRDNTGVEYSSDTGDNWIYWAGWKLEKGSMATDWCPNPTEILTQSDYAKIKAAIVALGGSLS